MFKFLSFINKLLPKKKRILLYSNLGFRDNIEVLYRYLKDNEYDKYYDIVCVSNNFYNLKKKSNIKYIGIYSGVFYFMFSKYFFYFGGKYPIKPSKNQMVVNLWHGIPIKKIGNLMPGFEQKDYNFFSKLVYYSDFFKPIMKNAFGASDDQLLLAGNLRNDDLFNPIKINNDNIKNILWMPTYRSSYIDFVGIDTLIFNISIEQWKNLNNFLIYKKIILYVKLHPLEKTSIKLYSDLSNIKIVSDESLSIDNITLYSFIGAMDALLTDYSSVYFDYLLLDRPIGFILDDFDNYKEKRGFIFDNILELMPGSKIYNYYDLLDFFSNIANNIDLYKMERFEVNNKVNVVKRNFCEDLLSKINLSRGE